MIETNFNCSIQLDKEPNGNWGTVPLNGASFQDSNATFNGIFGAILDQNYDLSASSWNGNPDRFLWFDFSTSFKQR